MLRSTICENQYLALLNAHYAGVTPMTNFISIEIKYAGVLTCRYVKFKVND